MAWELIANNDIQSANLKLRCRACLEYSLSKKDEIMSITEKPIVAATLRDACTKLIEPFFAYANAHTSEYKKYNPT